MKPLSIALCVLFTLGIILLKTSTQNSYNQAHSVQIVYPVNHRFQLNLTELKEIFESDDIKDRHVVIVSVAGAFRKGKSFLLNFFLRYLYAQYKKHNVTDWIGENSTGTNELCGFKWRGGKRPATTGILMWSDIFTHDYEDGNRIAIILLDTQGTFDSSSSVRDCTTIFAMSTLLSSVQCYNIMQNIQEDDLQHLQLFTEYARLALEQSHEKPFQHLLFIVRDWPYPFETDYGFHGQSVLAELLAENAEQTPEMHLLRKQIKSSFDEINAFLLPHPGFIVSQGRNFTGNLKDISVEFIKYLKILVPALLAPENLFVKKINGQVVRISDLISYLREYMSMFNGNALPEPSSVLMATAEASNSIFYSDSFRHYMNSMQNLIENDELYFNASEFRNFHLKVKNMAADLFESKVKLGGKELALRFQRKLDESIENQFNVFERQNEKRRKVFIIKAKSYNGNKIIDIERKYKEKMDDRMIECKSYFNSNELDNLVNGERKNALAEFDAVKMGDQEISKQFREIIDQNLYYYKYSLGQRNEAKKYVYYGGNAVACAAIGSAVAGAPGAIFGAIVGGMGSLLYSLVSNN